MNSIAFKIIIKLYLFLAGMLEFHISIFEKLYKAAVIMNITVLTKLLDAQKKPIQTKTLKRKFEEVISPSLSFKSVPKASSASELPPPLPGRKVPVWKRKTAPASSHSDYSDKWASDPLMMHDARPKPTRFEWPDEDLPSLPLMDGTFEEISYTSKPLLTQEEEIRAISNVASTSSSLEDERQASPSHTKKNINKAINEISQEGKTRNKSDSSGFEESKFLYHYKNVKAICLYNLNMFKVNTVFNYIEHFCFSEYSLCNLLCVMISSMIFNKNLLDTKYNFKYTIMLRNLVIQVCTLRNIFNISINNLF